MQLTTNTENLKINSKEVNTSLQFYLKIVKLLFIHVLKSQVSRLRYQRKV